MESYFAQMILALQAYIPTKVPEIRFVEQDLGQLESPDEMGRYPVSWPCVLIDFTETLYSDLSQNIQEAESTVQLRLGFQPVSFTSNLQPEHIRKQGLNYYEIENRLYQALQGWAPADLCQPLTRQRAISEKREDFVRVRVLPFTTRFEDWNAHPSKVKVDRPALDIDYHQTT